MTAPTPEFLALVRAKRIILAQLGSTYQECGLDYFDWFIARREGNADLEAIKMQFTKLERFGLSDGTTLQDFKDLVLRAKFDHLV